MAQSEPIGDRMLLAVINILEKNGDSDALTQEFFGAFVPFAAKYLAGDLEIHNEEVSLHYKTPLEE